MCFALIQASGGLTLVVITAAAVSLTAAGAFAVAERRSSHPMLPLELFRLCQFASATVLALVTYAALGGVIFLFVAFLQVSLGYTALQAGAATLPVTIQPSLAVFGAGLAALITPISATVLASVDARHSGIASAVNNALSRLGQMIAVAALPLAAGLSGADFEDPAKLAAGFPVAMTISAGASFAAALLAWTTIRNDALSRPGAGTTPVAKELPPSLQRHCAVAGTPLATPPRPRPSSHPPTARKS